MHFHMTTSNFTQRAHKGHNNLNLLQHELTDVLRADFQFHTLNRATPSQNLRPLLPLWHMPIILKNLQSTRLAFEICSAKKVTMHGRVVQMHVDGARPLL